MTSFRTSTNSFSSPTSSVLPKNGILTSLSGGGVGGGSGPHLPSSSGPPCKCCPYGFHIDTDFVRYCDALLTALYGANRSPNFSCRSFGSLRRKLNLALSASPENALFSAHHLPNHSTTTTTTPTKSSSFLSYCDLYPSAKGGSSYFDTSSSIISSSSATTNDTARNNHYFTLKEIPFSSVAAARNGSGSVHPSPSAYSATTATTNHHFHSNASIETDASVEVVESMLSEAVNKFEEVLLESSKSSSSLSSSQNLSLNGNVNGLGGSRRQSNDDGDPHQQHQQQNQQHQQHQHPNQQQQQCCPNSPPPSPTPSSCPSSSISRSVLTQIRSHLALSLTRVQELESAVAQVPLLKQQIAELQRQRDELQAAAALELVPVGNGNCRISPGVHPPSTPRLSISKGESISIGGTESSPPPPPSSTRSIGTLTSFAPSLPPRNAFAQTELRGRDLVVRAQTVDRATWTGPLESSSSSSRQPRTVSRSTSTETPPHNWKEVVESVSREDAAVQASEVTLDKAVSTSELSFLQDQLRPTSLDLMTSEQQQPSHLANLNQWMYPSEEHRKSSPLQTNVELHISTASPVGNSSSSGSSNSSSQGSIRLCEKCSQQMTSSTTSTTSESGLTCSIMLPENIQAALALAPTIIKSDSGISVERTRGGGGGQVGDCVLQSATSSASAAVTAAEDDHPELLAVFPDMEMSGSMYTQSSSTSDHDQEIMSGSTTITAAAARESQKKVVVVREKKPLDYAAVQPTQETKAALRVINDNLADPKRSSSFLFSKSVSSVKKIWFKISSTEEADSRVVELYIDTAERFSTRLLDFVVNLTDSNGNTAMHYSISFQNFDVVSVLLDSKVCDVNKYNKAGYTATMLVSLLHIENAVYRDVVDRLFHQADVNMKAKQNGQTALMLAAAHGRVEICKMLLDCGAEVNLQDNDGSSALMCASEHGHPKVISVLLAHPDTDPLLEDNEGCSALKIALINGHNDVGILLYTGTRVKASFYGSACYSSLSRLPNSPIYSGAIRRAGSFSYSTSPGGGHSSSSIFSLRSSPPSSSSSSSSSSPPNSTSTSSHHRNHHHHNHHHHRHSLSTPSSPSSRS